MKVEPVSREEFLGKIGRLKNWSDLIHHVHFDRFQLVTWAEDAPLVYFSPRITHVTDSEGFVREVTESFERQILILTGNPEGDDGRT